MSKTLETPNREILRLAIPNILSNVSVPLLSTVDTILMGQLSPAHLGAVGIGSMIFNFIYWNFGFLRMGTTGMTAQAYGAGDRLGLRDTLGRALLVALLISLLLLLLQGPIGELSVDLMQVNADQVPLVMQYFSIRIWAAPASLAIYVLTGWLFGMQNSVYPLIITIAVNVVNIVLSYIFVMHLQWEVAGVAWSTVVAQYTGVVVCIFLLLHRYRLQLAAWSLKRLSEMSALKRFLTLNLDLFIRTVCLTLVFAFFYSESSSFGETLLAVNIILLQLINWASYGIDGFAYAAESVVGKYRGAQHWSKLRLMIKLSMLWGLLLGVFFSACYAIFREPLVKLFSDDASVALVSTEYVWYAILFPIVGFMCYIWDGIYIGLTASRAMRNTMLVSLAIFYACYELVVSSDPNHLLWISLLIFLAARGLFQSALFAWKGWELK